MSETIADRPRSPDADTPPSSPVPAPVPTKTRFVVLGVLCLLSAVLYLDRICISQALPSIKADLKISNTETSYILMSFTLAYGLFEVPTGRWGDRIGGRSVLTRISLWWSAFTALTGYCNSLWMMIGMRFSFGAGEAVHSRMWLAFCLAGSPTRSGVGFKGSCLRHRKSGVPWPRF